MLDVQDSELNEREIEILRLAAHGLTNKAIAERTGLTLNTVKWYMKQVFGKLYVNNRTEAVTKAQALHLLEAGDGPTHNLPHALTPLIGRDDELERLGAFLADNVTRLITLHGVGGTGKTRLAVEAARRSLHLFSDGVVYVSLVPVHHPERLAGTLATALRLSVDAHNMTMRDLIPYLRRKNLLLVLDNFEHLRAAGPELSEIMLQLPEIKVLITSREVLNLRGEVVFALDGMSMPPLDAADPAGYSAVQLFVQAAYAVMPGGYFPDERDYRHIAAVTRHLEGMPLAIELAASWISVLPADKIAAEIKHNLDFLSSEMQDLPQRHRSIRAVIGYSWRKLTEDERQLMAGLSLFRGSIPFEAAQATVDATPEMLRRLVNKAFLRQYEPGRFDLHELLRQYAAEMLKADAEAYRRITDRFTHYHLHTGHLWSQEIARTLDVNYLRRMAAERDNFTAAWYRALRRKQYDLLEQAVDAGYFCNAIGWWEECNVLFQDTLDAIDADGIAEEQYLLRGKLLAWQAVLAYRRNDWERIDTLTEAGVALLEGTEYPAEAALALAYKSLALAANGDFDAAEHVINRAQAFADAIPEGSNLYTITTVRRAIGGIHVARGAPEAAIAVQEETLHLVPPMALNVSLLYMQLSLSYYQMGDVPKSLHYMEIAYRHGVHLNDTYVITCGCFLLHQVDESADRSPAGMLANILNAVKVVGSSRDVSQALFQAGYLSTKLYHGENAANMYWLSLMVLAQAGEFDMLAEYMARITAVLPGAQADVMRRISAMHSPAMGFDLNAFGNDLAHLLLEADV